VVKWFREQKPDDPVGQFDQTLAHLCRVERRGVGPCDGLVPASSDGVTMLVQKL
jgi:hypothetical protein